MHLESTAIKRRNRMQSVNVSMENFQTDVVDASQNLPVVLLFWAEQVPQSVQVKNSNQRGSFGRRQIQA